MKTNKTFLIIPRPVLLQIKNVSDVVVLTEDIYIYIFYVQDIFFLIFLL